MMPECVSYSPLFRQGDFFCLESRDMDWYLAHFHKLARGCLHFTWNAVATRFYIPLLPGFP